MCWFCLKILFSFDTNGIFFIQGSICLSLLCALMSKTVMDVESVVKMCDKKQCNLRKKLGVRVQR